MVGIYRRSIDLTVEEVTAIFAFNRAVNTTYADESLKDNTVKKRGILMDNATRHQKPSNRLVQKRL
jgi:hypothetical protein